MTEGDMWVTLDLLVGRAGRRTARDLVENIEEWLNGVSARIAAASETSGTPTSVGISDLPEAKEGDPAYDERISPRVECSFSHPHVRSRLEKLMGSNIARITDRRYMQRLQERIQEDHVECLEKRIKMREADEIEREKKLFLDGKVPVEQAPKELCEHPVFRITQVTKKLIDAKRCRESIHSSSQIVFMRSIMEDEDEVDVGAGEAAAVKGQMHQTDSALSQDKSVVLINIIDEKGSLQEFTEEKGDDNESQLQVSPSKSEQDDIAKGYMFTQEEYDRLKYESPLVKQLRKIETVEEMYRLADEIVGPLKTLRRK